MKNFADDLRQTVAQSRVRSAPVPAKLPMKQPTLASYPISRSKPLSHDGITVSRDQLFPANKLLPANTRDRRANHERNFTMNLSMELSSQHSASNPQDKFLHLPKPKRIKSQSGEQRSVAIPPPSVRPSPVRALPPHRVPRHRVPPRMKDSLTITPPGFSLQNVQPPRTRPQSTASDVARKKMRKNSHSSFRPNEQMDTQFSRKSKVRKNLKHLSTNTTSEDPSTNFLRKLLGDQFVPQTTTRKTAPDGSTNMTTTSFTSVSQGSSAFARQVDDGVFSPKHTRLVPPTNNSAVGECCVFACVYLSFVVPVELMIVLMCQSLSVIVLIC